MNNILGGGLYSLAVILASGYILHDAACGRHILRQSPPPIPYFKMLAFGLGFWWLTPQIYGTVVAPVLEWASNFLNPCAPSVSHWLANVSEADVEKTHRPAALFFIAALVRVILDAIFSLVCRRPAWANSLKIRQLKGMEFEKLICEAAARQTLIMLTLRNRKVYIGKASYISPATSDRNLWVRVVPWKSGYRDEETGRLRLTTNYEDALRNSPDEDDPGKDVSMCIPARDVVALQLFNPNLYLVFQSVEYGDSEAGSYAVRS